MTLTETLAHYFTNLYYEAMPVAVADKAKENLIDTLAGAIPGVTLPDVSGMVKVCK